MHSIPIFDSLVHPTESGAWLAGHKADATMQRLLVEMKESNTQWAFAVGMKSVGDYNEKTFVSFVAKHTNLFPVAFIDPNDNITAEHFAELKKVGYIGIKLHPRLSDFSLDDKRLVDIIKQAHGAGLVTFLCTYFYDSKPNAAKNNLDTLLPLLAACTEARIVLLHSGAVRVLEMVEVTRAFKNILLDLSFTLVKYEGSSLDADIKYLFNNFDRRICIGSDFPEISLTKMRERFEFFSKDVPQEKLENIAYKNIISFTGVNIK